MSWLDPGHQWCCCRRTSLYHSQQNTTAYHILEDSEVHQVGVITSQDILEIVSGTEGLLLSLDVRAPPHLQQLPFGRFFSSRSREADRVLRLAW